MDNKNFNLDKAIKLRHIYRKKRHYAKLYFINDLLSCQLFTTHSIIGRELSVVHNYQKRTAEAVCKDLGYKLVEFHHCIMINTSGTKCYGIGTEFTFTK